MMAINIEQKICDGHLLKWLVAAGLAWLEQNREQVDRLNVFPVPDGDTGKNMLLTMRSAYNEISRMDEARVDVIGASVARGALMGARGNSGVILSQLWQGFTQTLQGHDVFDSVLFVDALEAAVDMAYKAVVTPVEGTILTVARQAVEAVRREADDETDLRALLEVMVEAAEESLKLTPDLLPVLKKAGVVDSGGQGLVYILRGMLRLLNGEYVTEPNGTLTLAENQTWQLALEPEDEEGYGYDVQFLMHGQDMDVTAIRDAINAMGWSTLVVGDSDLIKVHVHVHDPGQPLSYAIQLGAIIDDVVVENMQEQYHAYVEDRLAREQDEPAPANDVAVVTVVSGEGLRRLFKNDLQAAHVIAGGQTMNPSTQDFLAAIDTLQASKVILLPNNKNILLAAQQAASLARDKAVKVVASRTIPQGISALLAYTNVSHLDDLEEVSAEMEEALHYVISAEVTTATRDVELDGITVRQGQYIGLVDGSLVAASDDLTHVMIEVLQRAGASDHELITLYYGDNLREQQVQGIVNELSEAFPGQEFEIVRGDQPLYPFIVSVE